MVMPCVQMEEWAGAASHAGLKRSDAALQCGKRKD
jgi:hypothetical protein